MKKHILKKNIIFNIKRPRQNYKNKIKNLFGTIQNETNKPKQMFPQHEIGYIFNMYTNIFLRLFLKEIFL